MAKNTRPLTALEESRRAKRVRKVSVNILVYLALGLLAATFLFPVWWMVINSFKTQEEIYATINSIATFFPANWNVASWLNSYAKLFSTFDFFGQAILNSFLYSAVTIVGVLFINSLAGYALARIRFPGSKFLTALILILIMVPVETSIVPLYVILSRMGLLKMRVVAYLIPSFVSPFYIFMFRSFFMGIPKEIEEAASIDGASRFTIYRRLIIPVSLPIFATVAIFTFMGAWNDYVFAQLIFSDPSMQPLQVYLQLINNFNPQDLSLTMAALTFSTIPIAIVYIFCQKYIIEGVAFDGLK